MQYYSYYECAGKVPNEGRLEFTGKTVKFRGEEKRPKSDKKKNNRAYSRNHSKWDK